MKYGLQLQAILLLTQQKLLLHLIPLDQRICRMIVDRFEVLRFDHVSTDARLLIQRERHVAHQVLDKLGQWARGPLRNLGAIS